MHWLIEELENLTKMKFEKTTLTNEQLFTESIVCRSNKRTNMLTINVPMHSYTAPEFEN
jgi:hypothetical protein